MHELWKDLVGFEDRYQISSIGNVSLKKRPDRMLKISISHNGYSEVVLRTRDGAHKKLRINRAVAIAFVPNPHNKPQVNHEDGNKSNNCAANLTWVTALENKEHAIKNGLCKLIPVRQVAISGKIIRTYRSIADAARAVNADASHIRKVLLGQIKSCHGFHWEYVTAGG